MKMKVYDDVIAQKTTENVSSRAQKFFRILHKREILPAKSLIFGYTRDSANRSSCPFHVVDYIFRATMQRVESDVQFICEVAVNISHLYKRDIGFEHTDQALDLNSDLAGISWV